ncbi:hypothetical protein [Calothrix sp. NIES-2098]|uniref:hypothetical protein n=1 Tax=Calothrix sp. NIES-2098 TaxID=1954171 RepID=UPI000B5DEB5B|nr:hypothetical protein NIES2098_38120 [Calothrix sp. NIES-2098]
MTEYCNIGDKPKVNFKFATQLEEIYQSNVSPIDVSVEDFSVNTINYNPNGYRISFYSTNSGTPGILTVRDYNIVDTGNGNQDLRYVLQVQRCGEDGLHDYTNVDPNSITVMPTVTCPDVKPDKYRSRLHVKELGQTNDVFTVEGDYPCKYRVACSDCPPGTCRCDCDNYPGYCCLPCNEIGQKIAVITEAVRRLSNG